MSWKNILVIWKREMKGYFYTPLAYVFIGFFTFVISLMFLAFLFTYMSYMQKANFGMAPSLTIDNLSEAVYTNMHVLLLFVLPFFTMRLFTEEARQNTMALLMTSPIRTWDITLAKFLAGATMLLIILGVTLVFPFYLWLFSAPGPGGGPDLGIIFSTYLGTFLCGLSYIGFGLFWSSITESPLIAVMVSFVTNFGFWLFGIWAGATTGALQGLLRYLAVNQHYQAFAKGSLETKSAVYLLSLIFLSLFLTNRSLESRAWRS
jgi:ABC-2 type transport system permease protein